MTGTLKVGQALDGDAAEGPLLALLRVLADVEDTSRIADALVSGLLREYSPQRLSVYFVDESGDWLDEAIHHGVGPDLDRYARVPVAIRMPLTETFRTGEAAAWTMDAAAAEFPALAGWLTAHPESVDEEVFCVPVRAAGGVVGAMLVSLPMPVDRTWRLRLLLDAACAALAVSWGSQLHGFSRRAGHAGGTTATPRQRAIVERIRDGRTNAQIALELNVSVGTVKSDLTRLYRATGTSDRHALVDAIHLLG